MSYYTKKMNVKHLTDILLIYVEISQFFWLLKFCERATSAGQNIETDFSKVL